MEIDKNRVGKPLWAIVFSIGLCALVLANATYAQEPEKPDEGGTMYARWENGMSSDPDYFPIAVWLQSPRLAPRYKAAGINLYVGLWKGPTEEQLADLVAKTTQRVDAGIFRVALSFRSPKKRPGFDRYSRGGEEKTERNVLGVLMDKETILVLASLKPKVTARLRQKLVRTP